jgi:hypothetical protein
VSMVRSSSCKSLKYVFVAGSSLVFYISVKCESVISQRSTNDTCTGCKGVNAIVQCINVQETRNVNFLPFAHYSFVKLCCTAIRLV